MSFTGKTTFSAGSTLPEIAEDVSDLVAVNSPHETPLLDALGDAPRPARSTVHEWLEDELLPNADQISDDNLGDGTTTTDFSVAHASRFQVGDQISPAGSKEILLVTEVDPGGVLTVVRGYGGSASAGLTDGQSLLILGNAALEGDDASAARFTARSRKTNFTQIFSSTVEVSGSELAVRQLGVADELDYQKMQRTKELLRDLENCVINGRASTTDGQGSASVRRTMRGIVASITTNQWVVGADGFPIDTALTEVQLNLALRDIWKRGNGQVDLILVNGQEKRAINHFVSSNRRFSTTDEAFRDLVSVYESDFGVCRVVMSRWVPTGTVLLLDSSRIDVMNLTGRSFQYKSLARTGDREAGQILGEYTLEFRNENAHGVIRGFGA